ncbi:DUF1611 domain-containing protein [Stakelama pacifica]|uniref:Putative NAD-dependent epimerase/dehydratase family protein n=1 Tax=Stakelama pacifica TaxID=517720 RepID=A0A4R6FYH8_9SPHN|nr:DUF1611 domain-containing protein [Stakelama pacifica]TDN87032.1 putative NAD-dependent epimerase/dehydratase family protein [Stakelama pacifica]GGO91403.1 hypothetical protein GCM10011329_06060 [Stakelama pacifica]
MGSNAPAPVPLALAPPYLLFLGDTVEPGFAKTAFGLRDWAGDRCVGEHVLPGAAVTTGLRAMSPVEARAAGASTLVIGVANPGGVIPPHWIDALAQAIEAGLDIASGMHVRLVDQERLVTLAHRYGRRLIDIRTPPPGIPVATGRKRTGKRLLTVGTDCALGKKYTALAIARAFAARGIDSDFRATGQTGIMIAGDGMPIDSVVADFIAGAAESLSPDAAPDHWDVIEGQGALFHPAYSGVSLGLLHGSQPDVFVVCHQPGRTHTLGVPGYRLPGIDEVIETTMKLGRRTNPAIRCGGIALNTGDLDADTAAALFAVQRERHGLPVADPMRGGEAFDALIAECLRE